MKELSTEQKAIAYDEAIERANKWRNAPNVDKIPTYANRVIEEIFPELAESEEEKTKRILHSISSKISFHLRDIFTEEKFQCFDTWSNAWLKKQDEKKSAWDKDDEYRVEILYAFCEEEMNKSSVNSTAFREMQETRNWLNSLKKRIGE